MRLGELKTHWRDVTVAVGTLVLVGVIYLFGQPKAPLAATVQTSPIASGETIHKAPVRHASPTVKKLVVPILLYHYPPADFDTQLTQFVAKGYHAITPEQLYAAFTTGAALPKKPAIITFDDGFAVQMQAFELLKKHHLKATFYIIDGGAASRWCLGAGRRYHDPLQPKAGCGDAYLTWAQVKMLDKSGLITIGSHTVDHQNLATDTPGQAKFEISSGKQQLEAELGHSVDTFAYPYGNYDAAVVALVKAAGFTTAVTTNAGTTQYADGLLTLSRVRDVADLP